MKEITIEEMLEELEQYYEAAGFKNIRAEKLSKMGQKELKKLYDITFNNDLEDNEHMDF